MKQITVLCDNKAGVMADILETLGENGININGISTERGNLNEIRIMVDNPEEAKDLLEKKKPYVIHLVDIVVLRLSDKPGELAKVTKTLSEKDINIEYAYGFGTEDGQGLVAIWTDAPSDEVRALLNQFNVA